MQYVYKRDLMVVGIVLLGALVFLYVAGYLSFSRPFGLAFEPYVSVAESTKSPTGFFGSIYGNQPLAILDIDPWFLGEDVLTKTVVFHVRLRPSASQATPDNGLRNFVLLYNYCVPVLSYGYSYGYYQSTQCNNLTVYPSSVRSSAEGSIVTFDSSFLGGLPLDHNAHAMMALLGTVAFTNINQVKGKTLEVRASIDNPSDIIFEAINGQPVRVRLARAMGNWLHILSGYGYPRLH